MRACLRLAIAAFIGDGDVKQREAEGDCFGVDRRRRFSVEAAGAPPPETVAEFAFKVWTPASIDTVIVTTIVAPASTAPCEAFSSYVHVTRSGAGALAHVISYLGSPLPLAASPRAETLVAVTPDGRASVTVTTVPCAVGRAPSLRTTST